MGKTLRIVIIAVVAIVVILLAAPFLIPVNKFKPTIEEKASAALGRKVQVGDLSLSLISGSLGAQDLSIGDDPKFSTSPFLTAKSLDVGVEIMPLIFSKTLNVTGITINEPQVTLLKNPAGVWNYSSIGGSSKPAQAGSAPANSSSAPADISVKKLELKDGKIILGSTNSQKRSTYDHVNVTASDVSMNSKFPLTITASLPGGGDFKLDGNAGPLDKSDTALTPLDAKIHVGSLDLAKTGFLDPSLGLGGLVDLDSTIASQNGSAETKGTLKLSKALLVQGGSPAGVPAVIDFGTKYDLRKNSGVITPSTVKIGSAVAHVNGTYETKGEDTVVDVKLNGESMPAKDLQAFLPAIGVNLPKGASLNAGTLSTNLNIKGATDKLVTDGTIGLFAAKLEGFDLGAKMAPISALTGLKTGKDLEIEKFTTNVHVAPTGLRAENIDAVLPSLGTLLGNGTLDSKNNLDFKMAATITGGLLGGTGAPANGIGSVLGVVSGTQKNNNCKNGTTIPFLIQGTSSDPKFVPDVGGVAAGLLKSQLGCTGGSLLGAGEKGAKTPANAVEVLGGLFGKKKKP
ncbi:MAG: AsmA family protein [Acidobacteria bacterium]|nr:AsmA family protein [Acidobacteriota bacterium]MBS1865105.1 AsmA family protein [Acidobacteriota bacterium]